jgi:hypothetical protein
VIFIVLLQHALCVEPHELDAVICFGISRRRAGDEHHAFGGASARSIFAITKGWPPIFVAAARTAWMSAALVVYLPRRASLASKEGRAQKIVLDTH